MGMLFDSPGLFRAQSTWNAYDRILIFLLQEKLETIFFLPTVADDDEFLAWPDPPTFQSVLFQ
jgi:hypothetical protein